MQSQPARELTAQEVESMTDEQLGHLGLDYKDNLSVNSYTLIANEAKRRKALKDAALPFNPRTDISGDARYLWTRIFIWFWGCPCCSRVAGVSSHRNETKLIEPVRSTLFQH
jgi:hypothetical protein